VYYYAIFFLFRLFSFSFSGSQSKVFFSFQFFVFFGSGKKGGSLVIYKDQDRTGGSRRESDSNLIESRSIMESGPHFHSALLLSFIRKESTTAVVGPLYVMRVKITLTVP